MDSVTFDYLTKYYSCELRKDKLPEIDYCAKKIIAYSERYKQVARSIGNNIPYWFIGIVHIMEGAGKFTTHLHNGDPLTEKTVNVPAGRPKAGDPPFTWEESAEDAIRYMCYDKIEDWSINNCLYLFEKYNGMGYRKRGINSPYLWSYTDQYTKGKYGSDGKFNPNLVSKQPGCAAIMKRLLDYYNA